MDLSELSRLAGPVPRFKLDFGMDGIGTSGHVEVGGGRARSTSRNRALVTILDSQHFYIIFSSYPRGNLNMVNCPECGKPLKKNTRKAKYCCENNACSVIFVRHPDKQSIMEVTHKAQARS